MHFYLVLHRVLKILREGMSLKEFQRSFLRPNKVLPEASKQLENLESQLLMMSVPTFG